MSVSPVLAANGSRIGAEYALDLCARIAAYTDVPGTITRLFLSPATRKVHGLLGAEMEALGMAVRVDAVGNLRGLYAGAEPEAPVLLMGSHIDTVPDAGAYDGVLGVALGLSLVRSLGGRRLPFAIEVIAFSEEEGIRFRRPFLGSRGLLGQLTAEDFLLRDEDVVTFAQAVREFGSNPDELSGDLLTPKTFAFLEVHIEQGPVLESMDKPLGVVTSIVGQTRFALTFRGQANHAGTTPMPLRKDALAAAAEWIGFVEATARSMPGLVATVGSVRVMPGAANVIAGSAETTLDVRHASDEVRLAAGKTLLLGAEATAKARGTEVAIVQTNEQNAVEMDVALGQSLTRAALSAGEAPHGMTSGAGHDSMILANYMPSAMLFVRSPGGISHHASESVLVEDVEAALRVCGALLEQLEPALLERGGA